ncbi:hypothetical protein PGH12_05705 [Chryseobacterium wangxinyae]|uniref:hypothetical protein n=1 Tax=Chryseobacterium sp. CY350 TaxID=2997336 RepID=UPI00226F540B|nr:hypothetical protein [Chryseobacterium sp. CY350]MCY0976644.1 hypothetical protein [Chryseobacterium sp. CY350]WBZ96645.1 hypothetical protein PGH12_05705 [Chryseobacterium sp. CY350]
MELNFKIFKGDIKIPIRMGTLIKIEELADPRLVNEYRNSKLEEGIMWTFNKQEISKNDKNTRIIGRPSTDFKYIVATYIGLTGKYKPPYNSVIYNLDGSIHKILEIPPLKSPLAVKRIEFLNDENPPLHIARYEGALCFSGCGWDRLDNGKIVNFIAIDYDGELWETRVLDPETGEIGDLIHYGKN